MLFVNEKRKKLKNSLKSISNKGMVVNLKICIRNGLSVY